MLCLPKNAGIRACYSFKDLWKTLWKLWKSCNRLPCYIFPIHFLHKSVHQTLHLSVKNNYLSTEKRNGRRSPRRPPIPFPFFVDIRLSVKPFVDLTEKGIRRGPLRCGGSLLELIWVLCGFYIDGILCRAAITAFGLPLCCDLVDVPTRFKFDRISMNSNGFAVCSGVRPMLITPTLNI